MKVTRHLNVVRAVNDLRTYLAQEGQHKLAFALLSVVVFGGMLIAFTIDSHEVPVYKREITYVQQWPASRTDAEIIAQQKIDAPAEAKRKAERAAAEKARQDGFRKMNDRLEKLGI